MPIITPLIIVVAATITATGTGAASCKKSPEISVELNVQEAAINIVQDISLESLRTASARFSQHPAHAVLGFYAGTIGYVLNVFEISPGETGCLGFRLKADLMAVDRRIAIASDLVSSPCRLRAALDHYRHHAAAASLALHRFAAELPAKLSLEIEQYIQARQPTPNEARQNVDALLDAAVGNLTASLPQVQKSVDTADEIQSLSTSCDGI